MISKWKSDEWCGRNYLKTKRAILREHQDEQNNEDKGKIILF
jgi:hypothetical protein